MSVKANIISRAVGKARNGIGNYILDLPEHLIKYDEAGLPKAFNKKGKMIGWGLVGAGMVNAAWNEDETKHMGTFDSTIHSPTPDYSEYVKMKAPSASPMPTPAGADGSLVFALDRTKNGGFL